MPFSVESVVGGPLDFRTPHSFAERVTSPNEHMKLMGGYSANWILRGYNGDLRYAATVTEPQSGRQLETYTTEPGLLIYTGIGLSEKIVAKKWSTTEIWWSDIGNHPPSGHATSS